MSMVVTVAIIATGTGVVTPDIGNWHTALFDSTAKLANKTKYIFNLAGYCSCFSTFYKSAFLV